ncbi:MAG: hypothetical protein HRU20_22525 [Pseudomonadales bacterium]|nr:hypothetical protein [Pseudomonadales bacterium]
MLESQRVELLNTMGLKTFQPRFQLSAAKPSAALVLVKDEGAEDNAIEVAPTAAAQSSAQVSAQGGVQNSGTLVEKAAAMLQQQQMQDVTTQIAAGTKNSTASATDKKTTTTVTVNADKPLRFRQRLFRCGEFLMILPQPALQWQDERKAKAFFDDIYFALNKQRPEFYATDVFEWPPAKSFPLAHDISAARATFAGFLQPKINNPACTLIICWGEAAAKNFLDEKFERGKITHFQSRPVLFADELQAYFLQPRCKKLLWQDLQQLKASLASN